MVSTVVFEVRPDGNIANGGGYDLASAGVGSIDYSQQAAPVLAVADGVTNGTTTVTSVTGGFTAAMVGNVIKIAAGRFVIKTVVDPNTITVESNIGAGTGKAMKVGGALARPDDPIAGDVNDNVFWVRAGAGYTTSTAWVLTAGGGDGGTVTYAGYSTVRGDNGLATITATANLAPIVSGADQTIFKNFLIDGANGASRGMEVGTDCFVENVQVRRCSLSGMRAFNEGTRVRRCLFTECGSGDPDGGGLTIGTGVIASECEAHTNVSNGFVCANNQGDYLECVSHHNTGSGFHQVGDDGMRLRNCVGDANTLDGLHLASTNACAAIQVMNCVFSNNAGKGVNSVTTDYTTALRAGVAVFFRNNAFYNNAGGNYGQLPAGTGDLLLTANPYTNQAAGDYSLNGTTGGGASLRGAGLPGGIGLLGASALGSISYRDIGAVQTLGAAPTPAATTTLRSLWRELTNERDTGVVPDTTVDVYLNRGLEALNRLIRYHWTTDASTIVFTASTQEYSIPADCIDVEWIEWGGKELDKESMDLWRRGTDPWRTEQTGAPRAWALYGQKLIFRPAPDAAAVAKQASPIIRYVSKPDDFATFGAAQLNSQDWPVPVYYGAALWSVCHPESALSASRAKDLMDLFNTEAERIGKDYTERGVSK